MGLLQLRGIEKRFGATVALAGVDLQLAPGEVHALIGENGAGKSTLMNILSGAISADNGEIHLAGSPFSPNGPHDARSLGIAHIHQELSLCPHLSIAENIFLGIEPSRSGLHLGLIDRQTLLAKARAILREFDRDDIDPETPVSKLSVPDQQLVEISRALATDARVILMDEPTSSLQHKDVQRLFQIVRKLRDQGIAIIYISHFLEEIRQVADRYTVLRDGVSVDSGELKSVSDAHLVTAMVGRPMEDLFQSSDSHPQGDVIVSARNLASPPRLKSASFDLHRGEVLGIAGLIGSGRTELVRALFGLTPASGELFISGKPIALRHLDSSHQIAQSLGYLSEDRKGEGLCLQLAVADNLTMTGYSSCSRSGWIQSEKQFALSQQVIDRLNIKTSGPSARVLKLSGGNQQKVAFGRLLHQNPDVLLLDEPTRGIDIRSKADIYHEIRRLASEGKAILMVSSQFPELLGICDRIAVMSRGHLSSARAVHEWTPESIMHSAIGTQESAPRAN